MFRTRESLTSGEQKMIKSVEKTLSTKRISIEKGALNQQSWEDIFKLLTVINSFELSLNSNDANIQLYNICTPAFPFLRNLFLSCNKIVSIEALQHLDAICLNELNLQSKNITSVKALRKLYCPQLQELNIGSNPIREPECLSELYFPKAVGLFVQIHPNLKHIGQSKRWVVKLQPLTFPELALKSNSRRQEQQIDAIIKRKYPKIQVT